MDAADGAGGLLALVDVQAPAAAAASAQQQKQIAANGAGVGQRLKMLIMRYDDIAKSILQVRLSEIHFLESDPSMTCYNVIDMV